MIIHHQDNISAFAGAHTFYWPTQPLLFQRIAITTAAAANEEIEQARSVMRFLFSRLWGRVN